MGKKKFIDKKKSATFHLLARDSSDPNYDEGPSGDRIFVRVDNNPYSIDGFAEEDNEDVTALDVEKTHFIDDPNSIFADAPEDGDDEEEGIQRNHIQFQSHKASSSSLPDHVRKEILELGFPDDGYNYLLHLREIKNTGGGSQYYENSKATPEVLPLDVKAYDASRVRISGFDIESNENAMYNVAAKSVRVQKVVDPEVEALLDDSDMSRFGSDVEDLEEDFLVKANLPEEGEDLSVDEKVSEPFVNKRQLRPQEVEGDLIHRGELRSHQQELGSDYSREQTRVRRLLDEQFDMLTLQEYDTESDGGYDSSVAEEGEPLAVKLNLALKDRVKDDLGLDGKYKVPADVLDGNDGSVNAEDIDLAADVIQRCVEYGNMYNDEDQENKEVVIMEESSDESEMWDCETIVSTYSNLDNHPGKIEVPRNTRKKKLAETISAVSSGSAHLISLRGREKLPVEFLPTSKKPVVEKVKKESNIKCNQQRRRQLVEESNEEIIERKESKEEKKERKAAVKEERREARRAKKEMKGLYRCETQRAQRVAAISGPSAIHLM